MKKPLVSIYIPTFNRCDLLKRAVDSVRVQTYTNLEIIVVDDCSTDGTKEYLEDVSKRDCRIKFFLKEKNSGACISRNIAIKNASGEFITGLDDDDYFTPNRIELFLKKWECIPSDVIALFSVNFSNENHMNENNGIQKLLFFISKRKIKQRDLYFANYVGNQVFTKTENLRDLNGFDKDFKAWQDLEMWFRLSEKGSLMKIFEPTYFVDRSHEFNRITTQNISKILETQKLFIKKHKVKNRIYLHALNNHLFYYDKSKVSGYDVFVKLVFNFLDLKNNLKYLYLFLKYKFNRNSSI